MKKIKIFVITLMALLGLNLYAMTQTVAPVTSPKAIEQQTGAKTYVSVPALSIVAKPGFYLNKNVKVKAKFDKFSTLGLDYKPAMKSSETYISFLIQRDDVQTHNIPLSELKIFMKRSEAEKYIDLSSGDEIEFSGKVFSNALGDAWIDVDNFVVINSKTDKLKTQDK